MNPHDPITEAGEADWIEWSGGKNPVPGRGVWVRLDEGCIETEDVSDSFDWQWMQEGKGGDIIAYRVVTPAPAAVAPGHTDLMLSPEAIDAFLATCDLSEITAPAAVEGSSAGAEPRVRFRHKKRGTFYTLVGGARLQCAEPMPDMSEVVVYEGDDGDLWVRPNTEFWDGRFECVSVAALRPSSAADAKPVDLQERIAEAYSQGQDDALRVREWMQDKAWMDAVLMFIFYHDQHWKSSAHLTAEQADKGLRVAWDDMRRLYQSRPGSPLYASVGEAQPHPSQQAGAEGVERIAAFLKERDEALEPGEADDNEREASAQAILAALKTGEAG